MWLTHNLALSVSIAFISVPLPWVAVLLANQPGEATPETAKVYKPGIVREERRRAMAEAELTKRLSSEIGPPPGVSLNPGSGPGSTQPGRSPHVIDHEDLQEPEDPEKPEDPKVT